MAFLISMFLTSIIGFFICHKSRYLRLTEKVFISIFIGWGYFTNLILFFSNNFSGIGLDRKVLSALILFSLITAFILFVIVNRRLPSFSFREIVVSARLKLNRMSRRFHALQSRYYLIIPAIFLILFLLGVTINSLWYKIYLIDPIFQWDQRAELIFLEKNISGNIGHPFYYYPLHTPILHAWAYFFNFQNPRIFYAIALIGALAILIPNIYNYSRSMYCALVFSTMVAAVQIFDTTTNYAEGIGNIYFILGVLYALKYIEEEKIPFILLGSFFMTMYANTRGEGMLYLGVLLLFIIAVSISRKMFRLTYIGYYLLPFLVFYYIPRGNFKSILYLGGFSLFILAIGVLKKRFNIKEIRIKDLKLKYFGYCILMFFVSFCVFDYLLTHTHILANLVVHIKIIAKYWIDIFYNWGGIYKNKPLLHYYHANDLTCAMTSFVVFWESLFFDPQKVFICNLLKTFLTVCKQIGLHLWILLILALGAGIKERQVIRRFFILVIFPVITHMAVMSFLQIKYYYNPGSISTFMGVKRYTIPIVIAVIFFLSTSGFIKKIFIKIEQKKYLAYALNLPFLYLLSKQIWRMILIY